jgi:predicted ATPase/DNA-binding SARP family transcriptional activator
MGMPAQPVRPASDLFVALLGSFEVRVDGQAVGPAGARRRGLLALLALEPSRIVPVETLVDRLWGEDPPASAVNVIQTYVSAWRTYLGGRDGALRTVGAGYRFDLTETQCDLSRFRVLTQAAREVVGAEPDRLARAERQLDEALGLWRGPVLADLAGEAFHHRVADALEAEHARALEAWADVALLVGRDPGLVLERLEPLRRSDPLRESTAALAMSAHVAAGRQADALRTYDEVRGALRDELGADPSPVLREMHGRVLRADPTLMPRTRPEPGQLARPSVSRADPLFGRDEDIRRVTELLAERGLVTLTGPGGAGKTRLATEVLHRHLAAGAGWFADLAPVRDEALMPAAVAAAVGAPASAGTDPTAALTARLAHADAVLVLDNLEHLPGAAELVALIRAACPRLLLLVTSRHGLGIAGERQYPVPLLAVPDEKTARMAVPRTLESFDGIRLLVDRATAADPTFRLTEENAGAVAALVRQVDGLPLAIEIAAPWLRLLPPNALVERLSRTSLDLTAQRTDLPDRQRTLRHTIQWSYELLSEPERTVFRRLAVFVGSFSLAAAEEVCAGGIVAPSAVDETLLTLVDCHLVRPWLTSDGQHRFRLLETVREFANEQLAGDSDADDVHDRHLSFMSSWAAELAARSEGPDSASWLALAVAEADNLRAAIRRLEARGDEEALLQLAVDAMVVWFEAGHEGEGERLLHRALRRADPAAPARAIGLTYWAWLYATRDRAAAAAAAAEALDLARNAGDPLVEAFAQQTLGDTLGDPAAALRASHAVFEAADRSEGLAVRYGPTAPDAVRCGASASIAASWTHRSLDEALAWQRDALRLAEVEGDRRITAVNAARLAHLHLLQGDTTTALALLDRARTLVSAHVTARWEDIVAFAEAELAAHLGELEASERQLVTLIERATAGGRPLHARMGSLLLTDLLTHLGRTDEAAAVLDRLARTPGAIEEPSAAAAADVRRARLDRLSGRAEAAAARLEALQGLLSDDQLPPERALLLVEQAFLAGSAAQRRACVKRLAQAQAETGIRLPPWEKAQVRSLDQ